MRLLQFTVYNLPQQQILMLHNLIADYSAQDLQRGKQFSINDQLSFIGNRR